MLDSKLTERKKLFVDYGGSYEEYCKNSGKTIANILIIINNYSSFSEIYSDYEDNLSVLTRDGTKYGIYFMITASNTNAVRYRMLQNFKQILTLQLNDRSEYVGILGNTEGIVPSKCKGRGLIKYDKAYEFQTACISDNTSQTNELIMKLCSHMQKIYDIKAEKVPVLPDFVSPELFAEDKIKIERLPIGIDKNSMKTITINLAKNCIMPVISQDEDQSDVLQAIAELAVKDSETKIVVLDIEESFDLERTMEYEYHCEDLEDYIAKWFSLVVDRHNGYKASAGKITEEMNFYRVLYIIPAIDTLFSRLSDDRKDKLKLILEKSEVDFNIHIILSSSSSKYATMTHEPWYRKHCTSGNGIWIGDGYTERMQISINRVTKELYQPIGSAYAIAIQKGKYNLVKVVSVEEREDELV
jgi:S-DNA-T family DNA segregation ATPase FtsK/SpoIIIE